MNYRPELDGLRAIAVVAVLLYHAGFSVFGRAFFPGGYLGVDVFFVISGYLITLILLKEMGRDGFTFLGFYERRARRILPALFVVMVASIPFAWTYMLPSAFKSYAGSLAATTLFGSNIYFWQEDQYAADGGDLKPFLHTWSLAVEEQFYLLFPIVLLLCWKFCRRYIGALFLAGFVVSLLLAEWANDRFQNANFFLAPSRAWELLAGAMLAKLEVDRGRQAYPLANATLPALGAIMVIAPMLVLDDYAPHPGFVTLLPVLGTMLLIWFAGGSDGVSRLLTSRLAVGLGLISYSLYLWHQPIFAFARIRSADEPQVLDKLVWIALAVGLATLTYQAVETPFRNKRLINRRLIWTMASVGPAGLLVAGLYGFGSDGLPSRFESLPSFYFDVVKSQAEHSPTLGSPSNPCEDYAGDEDYCLFPHGAGEVTLATVGDSHLRTLSEPLREVTKGTDAAYLPLNRAACPLITGIDRVTIGSENPFPCTTDYNERRIAVLRDVSPAVAILGGRLPLILESTGFDNHEGGIESEDYHWAFVEPGDSGSSPAPLETVQRRFRETVERLLAEGIKVVLVYPIPEVGWNVPQRLADLLPKAAPEDMHAWTRDHMLTTSYDVYRERTASAYAVYDAVPDHPDLVRVYPETLFCNTRIPGRCITHDSEHVYYRDDDHLSEAGARMLVELMLRRMEEKWGRIPASMVADSDLGHRTLSQAGRGAER